MTASHVPRLTWMRTERFAREWRWVRALGAKAWAKARTTSIAFREPPHS